MIEALFPIPVMTSNINRQLTNSEKNCIEKSLEDQKPNVGNSNTNNVYLLEEPELATLKSEIEIQLQKYMDEIVCPENPTKFKITISWGNETKELGYHHPHTHQNSLVSGVFYPEVSESDKIYFNNPKTMFGTIEVLPKEFNRFNSKSWWLPVHNGDLFLFPSNLGHSVETIVTSRRVSIAFNTWIEGDVGSKDALTYIKF